VKKENPDVYAANKALETWLGPPGINGGSIHQKQTLSIEAETPATIHEVEEILDSEDYEVTEGIEPSQLQTPQQSSMPTRPLRQLTLLELFLPVG
jgi:hypothetical protein